MCHHVHSCHSSRTHTGSAEAVHPHLDAQTLTFHHWQESVASAARHLWSTAKSETQHARCWVSDESITLNTHCIYTVAAASVSTAYAPARLLPKLISNLLLY